MRLTSLLFTAALLAPAAASAADLPRAPMAAIRSSSQTPAPPPSATRGVTIADARAWLAAQGGSVSEPISANGAQTLQVADSPLAWSLTFYSCASLCDDVQYSAAFSAAGLTVEQINEWNRSNRFLKAYFTPAAGEAPAGAVVQYDMVLTGDGPEQLRDATAVWLQLLRHFAQTVIAPAAPAETPAP
jgi:hypothetical protein